MLGTDDREGNIEREGKREYMRGGNDDRLRYRIECTFIRHTHTINGIELHAQELSLTQQ